jgi:hypothetical protein
LPLPLPLMPILLLVVVAVFDVADFVFVFPCIVITSFVLVADDVVVVTCGDSDVLTRVVFDSLVFVFGLLVLVLVFVLLDLLT